MIQETPWKKEDKGFIKISNISGRILEQVVRSMYGDLHFLEPADLMDLLAAADFLEV